MARGGWLLLPVILAAFSCTDQKSAVRPSGHDTTLTPAWIPDPGRSDSTNVYVTAVCRDSATIAEGKACAINDAVKKLESAPGRKIIRTPGDFIIDRFVDAKAVPNGYRFDVWLLIGYPRSEIKIDYTNVANRILLVVFCNTGGSAKCPDGMLGKVEKGLSKGGMTVTPFGVDPGACYDNPSSILGVTRDAGASSAILVNLEVRSLSQSSDSCLAIAHAQYKMMSLPDGRIVSSYETGWMEDDEFSMSDAYNTVLDMAIDKMVKKVIAGD